MTPCHLLLPCPLPFTLTQNTQQIERHEHMNGKRKINAGLEMLNAFLDRRI